VHQEKVKKNMRESRYKGRKEPPKMDALFCWYSSRYRFEVVAWTTARVEWEWEWVVVWLSKTRNHAGKRSDIKKQKYSDDEGFCDGRQVRVVSSTAR
jgi:hypothetical protein